MLHRLKSNPSTVSTLIGSTIRLSLLTSLTMIAFAFNSLLARMALAEGSVDVWTFTTIRLASCTAMLLFINSRFQNKPKKPSQGKWVTALILVINAVTFSLAYVQLSAGTGALILFGTVQLTMLVAALKQGERPKLLEWLGLILSLFGLVYLVLPGITAPPLMGVGLMMIAGVTWGLYSLLGRMTTNPVLNTTANFARTIPFVIGIRLFTLSHVQISLYGVICASLSGALASGVGYIVWYTILKELTATRAAIVQLSVPLFAAAGGILFLRESISIRLVISALMILGGIGLALLGSKRNWQGHHED